MADVNAIGNRSAPLYVGYIKIDKNVISTTGSNKYIKLNADGSNNMMHVFTSSGETSLQIRNSDNTDSGSHASLLVQVRGDSNSDPYLILSDDVGSVCMGIDNDNDDRFVLCNSASIDGTNDLIRVSSDKFVTMPLQPCVLAYNSSNDNNQTGTGTVVTVEFDTVVYDIGGNFSSNTFTAPITGRYQFDFTVALDGITSADSMHVCLNTSNHDVYGGYINPQAKHKYQGRIGATFSCVVGMDAGDIANVKVAASGESSNQCGIVGDSTYLDTFISVYLAT